MYAVSKLLILQILALLSNQTTAGVLRLKPATKTKTTTTTSEGFTTNASHTSYLPKDIDEKMSTFTEKLEIAEEAHEAIVNSVKKNPNAEVLQINTRKTDDVKYSKLLLLSAPKSNERFKEPLENIEEHTELNEGLSTYATIPVTEIIPSSTATIPIPRKPVWKVSIDYRGNLSSSETSSNTEAAVEDESIERETEKQLTEEDNGNVDSEKVDFQERGSLDDDFLILDGVEYLNYPNFNAPFVHSLEIVPTHLEGHELETYLHK